MIRPPRRNRKGRTAFGKGDVLSRKCLIVEVSTTVVNSRLCEIDRRRNVTNRDRDQHKDELAYDGR